MIHPLLRVGYPSPLLLLYCQDMTPWGQKTITVDVRNLWNWMLLPLLLLHHLLMSDVGEIILSEGYSFLMITPNDKTFRIIDIAFSVGWEGKEIIPLIKHQDFTSILESLGKSESTNPIPFYHNSELFSMGLFVFFLLLSHGQHHPSGSDPLVWSLKKETWSSLTPEGLSAPL